MSSNITIPQNEWSEFLQTFSRRYRGSLVQVETHDLGTAEHVSSRLVPLESIELDLEDQKNPRINICVRSEQKQIKHILFRPSSLVLYVSSVSSQESLRIESVNTSTTVRFHTAETLDSADEVA